jgi:hypothetical protein
MSTEATDLTPEPRAIVIAAEGPFRDVQLERREGSHLNHLQELVDGYIEAIRIPAAFDRACRATCYVNEEGKYTEGCVPNMRATDFLVPGFGIPVGDCVRGTMVLVGFDPVTGEHLSQPPEDVIRRAKLIASESGAGWEGESPNGGVSEEGEQ